MLFSPKYIKRRYKVRKKRVFKTVTTIHVCVIFNNTEEFISSENDNVLKGEIRKHTHTHEI